jgi:hypothetical protein
MLRDWEGPNGQAYKSAFCDRCMASAKTFDGPMPAFLERLRGLGWEEQPRPTTPLWWCPSCVGQPMSIPKRKKRHGR